MRPARRAGESDLRAPRQRPPPPLRPAAAERWLTAPAIHRHGDVAGRRPACNSDMHLEFKTSRLPSCSPPASGIGWQGVGTIADDTLVNGTTILSQVQAVQAAGGHITISFGGAAGQEAALTAKSAASLQAEYQSVIDRYHIDFARFRHRGRSGGRSALDHVARPGPGRAPSRRTPRRSRSPCRCCRPVWSPAGSNVLQSAKHDGVRVDVVNIMAMDYGGPSVDNNGQMGLDAINAVDRDRVSNSIILASTPRSA